MRILWAICGSILVLQACAPHGGNVLVNKDTPTKLTLSALGSQKLLTEENKKESTANHASEIINATAARSHSSRLGDYKLPYPFTGNDLWAKLLKVVTSPNGYVSAKQIEAIFNISMPLSLGEENFRGLSIPNNPKSNVATRYLAKQGRDWYFNVQVDEFREGKSNFRLDWGSDAIYTEDVLPDDICLNVSGVRDEIEKLGWVSINNFYAPPPGGLPLRLYFRKDKRAVLRISFVMGVGCLTEISMYSDVNDMNDDAFNAWNKKLFKDN